jgi:hypothetical protein
MLVKCKPTECNLVYILYEEEKNFSGTGGELGKQNGKFKCQPKYLQTRIHIKKYICML